MKRGDEKLSSKTFQRERIWTYKRKFMNTEEGKIGIKAQKTKDIYSNTYYQLEMFYVSKKKENSY